MLKRFFINFFYIIFLIINSILGIIFGNLYLSTLMGDSISANVISAIITFLISLLTLVTIVFNGYNNNFVVKIITITLFVISIGCVILYLLKKTGILNVFKDVDSFRIYISSFGAKAILPFVLLQFLQVIILPVPSIISLSAGVLLFGPILAAIYSCLGVITGSLVAFLIGRKFGIKAVEFLFGRDKLYKVLDHIRGKDKLVFTFMFLFPLFPDDLLCFVAGVTDIPTSFFVKMIIIVRAITIFLSSFTLNNNLIPFDTPLGIFLWVLFIIFVVVSYLFIVKKGDTLFKSRKS